MRLFYELLAELGHGGLGVVYKARQIKLNRIVALKMLLLGQFSNEQTVKRFQREARSAAALNHVNIVAIHDVGEVEGQHYFTMEFVEGRSLGPMLRDGPLPPRQAARYCRAIAEAINAARSAGIIHRDLKPSNIVIDLLNCWTSRRRENSVSCLMATQTMPFTVSRTAQGLDKSYRILSGRPNSGHLCRR